MRCRDALKKYGVNLTGTPSTDKKKIRKLLLKFHPDKGGKRSKYDIVFKCYKLMQGSNKKRKEKEGCQRDEYSLGGRCFKRINDDTFYDEDFCRKYRNSTSCRIIEKYDLLPKNYVVSKILGKGSYGKVYLLCNQTTLKCDRAIKIGIPRKRNRREDFEEELQMTRRFHKLGIGPKLYDGKWIKKENTFYMVTGRIDDTLENYLKKKRTRAEINEVFYSIHKLLKKMRKEQVLHGDFHSGNIGLIQKGNKIEAVPIDFGFSYNKPTKYMVNNGIYNLELVQLYRVEKYIDNKYPNNKYVVKVIEKIIEDILGTENASNLKRYSLEDLEYLMDTYYNLYR